MTSFSTILNEQAAQITPHSTPVLHSERVYCVAFSPDGRHLVSGSVNRQVNIWEVGKSELKDYMRGHTKFVWSLAFSPDHKTLASTSGDGTIFLWDIEKRSHYRIEESHYALALPLYGVAFSPTGEYFAAGCLDGVIRLWSTASKRPPWKLKGHKSGVYSVAFSPDGLFLATGGNDFTVRIWNLANKCEEKILTRHGCRVTSVIYSPDGLFLAYASTDTNIYIVNLRNGESQTLSGHGDLVWSIAFSPDSRLIISGSNDHTVRLWEVESSRQIQILKEHQDDVNSVAFSPDGNLAASASNDRTVRVWDLSLLNERPETYLRLVNKQEKYNAVDGRLLSFINAHRRSLDNSLMPLSIPETSIRWLRPTLSTKNPPPLGLIQDLGLTLTSKNINLPGVKGDESPYSKFILDLRANPIIEEIKGLKLKDNEIGGLIAQLLEGIIFDYNYRIPENRPLFQACRLLEAALRRSLRETQGKKDGQSYKNNGLPFLKFEDMEKIRHRLRNLTTSDIRFLKDLYAHPGQELNQFIDYESLAELIPLESLPSILTELYSQLLAITPKLKFNDHRGSQTYSCGGYHGLTHKGGLDNLSLSEHLYPKTLLQHRILNHEALYYGREGEREKRRRMTLIITQSGLELSGTSKHLSDALTLAAISLTGNLGGDLRHVFFGSKWSAPVDPHKPGRRQQIVSWEDNDGLNLETPFSHLLGQLKKWHNSYHHIDTLWIIDRHFGADQSNRKFIKTMKELQKLSQNRAWFIGLETPCPVPPAAIFFHQHLQIVMQNDKIITL